MEVKCYGDCEIAYVNANTQTKGVGIQKMDNIISIKSDEYENLKYNSYCLEEVRKSFSYKVGLFLTKPVRMLREKLSK